MTDWPSQTSPFTQLAAPDRSDRNTTATVVEIDAGRKAAARTPTDQSGAPTRAAAPSTREHHAAFHNQLHQARKAYDEQSPSIALFHLRMAARLLDEELIA